MARPESKRFFPGTLRVRSAGVTRATGIGLIRSHCRRITILARDGLARIRGDPDSRSRFRESLAPAYGRYSASRGVVGPTGGHPRYDIAEPPARRVIIDDQH